MFTGLVQGTGYLRSKGANQLLITCPRQPWVEALTLGDSVAVDGVCLTVETLVSGGFLVTTSPETMQRTTLEQRVKDQVPINLEPALRVGDRLGGHFVTGHIDDIGIVEEITQTGDSWVIRLRAPTTVASHIVSKGSIAVNGISLTVADCSPEGNWFTVAVIPHSFAQTNLQQLRSGHRVNLETDVLSKYVAKFLNTTAAHDLRAPSMPLISPEFLAEHGFG
jgi:riboflavin synthase